LTRGSPDTRGFLENQEMIRLREQTNQIPTTPKSKTQRRKVQIIGYPAKYWTSLNYQSSRASWLMNCCAAESPEAEPNANAHTIHAQTQSSRGNLLQTNLPPRRVPPCAQKALFLGKPDIQKSSVKLIYGKVGVHFCVGNYRKVDVDSRTGEQMVMPHHLDPRKPCKRKSLLFA